jgi:hypothetical protein
MDLYVPRHADPSPLAAERLDSAGYQLALADAQAGLGIDEVSPLDAVIHGVAVRLYTTNARWRRFWSANWFAPDQWASLVGGTPPNEPRIHVYALETDSVPWAGYSEAHSAAFLSGDVPYGPLRALALGAVALLLAKEEAAHFVPGAIVKQNGQGALLLPGPGVDPASFSAELMAGADAHVFAMAGAFVRYGMVRMVDGVTLLPTMLFDEGGVATRGYRLFPWLDDYGYDEPRADVRCISLAGDEVYCFSRDLDLGRTLDALAFPIEQAWYVPTKIVASDAGMVGALWHGALEGVPGLSPDLWQAYGERSREAVSALAATAPALTRAFVADAGELAVAEALVRLRAAPHGRAMVTPEQLWPGRASGHPWRAIRIERAALLDGTTQTDLTASALGKQLERTRSVLAGLWDEPIEEVFAETMGRALGGGS